MQYPIGFSQQSVVVGDFNNDTVLYIVVANFGLNNLGVFLGHGNGTFSHQLLIPMTTDSIHSLFSLLISTEITNWIWPWPMMALTV
jgi:hypothetical protein